jgi:cytochrome c
LKKTVLFLCITGLLIFGCSSRQTQSKKMPLETRNSDTLASQQGKALFESKCMMCHLTSKPTKEQFKTLLAPAIMGVMRHVKMGYPNKKEAVNFMVDYTLNPTKEKAICMDKKIEKFGLMPSQKTNVTKEELTLISEYLYDNFPPANFRGMGRGNRK